MGFLERVNPLIKNWGELTHKNDSWVVRHQVVTYSPTEFTSDLFGDAVRCWLLRKLWWSPVLLGYKWIENPFTYGTYGYRTAYITSNFVIGIELLIENPFTYGYRTAYITSNFVIGIELLIENPFTYGYRTAYIFIYIYNWNCTPKWPKYLYLHIVARERLVRREESRNLRKQKLLHWHARSWHFPLTNAHIFARTHIYIYTHLYG